MKKRAMKKWIPKDTCYCYEFKDGKYSTCKWLRFNKNKNYQEDGYCKYLGTGDWYEDGTMLLWDQCKECGVSDNNLIYKAPKKRKWQK